MAFKILSLVLLVVSVHADVNTLVNSPHVVENFAPAEYNFEYSVNDAKTGDVKNQKEVRHGDSVQGSYSLLEADGTRRVVEYTADEETGFNAVVHREPPTHTIAFTPSLVKTGAQSFPGHHL